MEFVGNSCFCRVSRTTKSCFRSPATHRGDFQTEASACPKTPEHTRTLWPISTAPRRWPKRIVTDPRLRLSDAACNLEWPAWAAGLASSNL